MMSNGRSARPSRSRSDADPRDRLGGDLGRVRARLLGRVDRRRRRAARSSGSTRRSARRGASTSCAARRRRPRWGCAAAARWRAAASCRCARRGSARPRRRTARPARGAAASRGPRRAARPAPCGRGRPRRSRSAARTRRATPSPAERITRPFESRSTVMVCPASSHGRRRGTGREHRAEPDALGDHGGRRERRPRVGGPDALPDEEGVPPGCLGERRELDGQVRIGAGEDEPVLHAADAIACRRHRPPRRSRGCRASRCACRRPPSAGTSAASRRGSRCRGGTS